MKKSIGKILRFPKSQDPQMRAGFQKSLPNLEELREAIPSNCLVSEEDDLKSRQDFKEIMCELKSVKVENQQEE